MRWVVATLCSVLLTGCLSSPSTEMPPDNQGETDGGMGDDGVGDPVSCVCLPDEPCSACSTSEICDPFAGVCAVPIGALRYRFESALSTEWDLQNAGGAGDSITSAVSPTFPWDNLALHAATDGVGCVDGFDQDEQAEAKLSFETAFGEQPARVIVAVSVYFSTNLARNGWVNFMRVDTNSGDPGIAITLSNGVTGALGVYPRGDFDVEVPLSAWHRFYLGVDTDNDVYFYGVDDERATVNSIVSLGTVATKLDLGILETGCNDTGSRDIFFDGLEVFVLP